MVNFKVKREGLAASVVVWDAETGKALCTFVDGVFETEDATVIEKLVALGYEHDGDLPEPQDDADDELAALREKAKELGIKHAGSKGKEKLIEEIDIALKSAQ